MIQLEKYKGFKTRHKCPECGKINEFTRYVDESGNYIALHVDKCNRIDKCGYHYPPKQFYLDNPTYRIKPIQKFQSKTIIKNNVPDFVNKQLFKESLKCYNVNTFVKYLINLFDKEITTRLIKKYYIGTSKKWRGATIFWLVDIMGNVRSGKIMLYDKNGSRIKNKISWVHRSIKDDFKLSQCFFGENLIRNTSKPIAIVESEKTAIIASVYMPEFIWLACGAIHGLNAEKCKVLKGRNVILFPDLNAYDLWNEKAYELRHITTFKVSNFLEKNTTKEQREQGLDLSDFLVEFEVPKQVDKSYLEYFDDNIKYPPTPFKFYENMKILDPHYFIKINIGAIKECEELGGEYLNYAELFRNVLIRLKNYLINLN